MGKCIIASEGWTPLHGAVNVITVRVVFRLRWST